MQDGFVLKREDVLLDPHGLIRVTLWGENFTKLVNEGKTYLFTKVHVKKSGQDVYLSTAKTGCAISKTSLFVEQLPLPPELPHTFLTTTTNVEITGVNKFASYYSCTQCHKKLSAQDSHVAKCTNCGLIQKLSACTSHWYLLLIVKPTGEDTFLTVTLFDDVIKDVLTVTDNEDTPITEDAITDVMLGLPEVQITLNNKTKIVSAIEIYH